MARIYAVTLLLVLGTRKLIIMLDIMLRYYFLACTDGLVILELKLPYKLLFRIPYF